MLPAYAGTIPAKAPRSPIIGGAPRVCGDDPVTFNAPVDREGCSPRMRG